MRTPEQQAEYDRYIAAQRERLLEKARANREAKRAHDRTHKKTAKGKATQARASAKYQRRHASQVNKRQRRHRLSQKLRRGGRQRVHTRRNPDMPRILLAGTDSVLTLDELRSPRYIVISPRHPTIIERLPYEIPFAT
jgi:hypothetical protein